MGSGYRLWVRVTVGVSVQVRVRVRFRVQVRVRAGARVKVRVRSLREYRGFSREDISSQKMHITGGVSFLVTV
jgi:hypothetical protein